MEISSSGIWWLPEKPDDKLSGQLTYQLGNRAILSLNGMFDEKVEFHEIILGNIDDHKITLVNCMRVSWTKIQAGTGDSSSSKFSLIAICKGHHFLKKDDLLFNTISVRYSHLRQWLAATVGGGEKERAYLKERDPYLKLAIEKSLIINFSPEISIEIKGFLERESHFYYSPYNQETEVLFHLKSQKLNAVLENVDIFRNFLSICIDEKIAIVSIEAQEEYGTIQLILPSILKPSNGKDRIFFIPEPIERFLFIKNAKLFLENWFLLVKKYESMYQLFFSDNFEQLYITTRFLNYAQAMEAYHARKYESRFFPDNIREIIDEFTNFSKIINIVFAKSLRSAILRKFEFLNRKSLRMILKDFFKDFKDFFSIFIRDKSDFIDLFVKTRNYYTHYNPTAKEPSYKQIIVLTENARFILLSIFLKEIGLSEQDIKAAIYRYCRSRVREIKSL